MSRKQEHPIQYSGFDDSAEMLRKPCIFSGFQVDAVGKTEED